MVRYCFATVPKYGQVKEDYEMYNYCAGLDSAECFMLQNFHFLSKLNYNKTTDHTEEFNHILSIIFIGIRKGNKKWTGKIRIVKSCPRFKTRRELRLVSSLI